MTSDLMVTAVVDIFNHPQRIVQARSLIDTCSTSNFMTQNMSSLLGLKIYDFPVAIGALNTLSTRSKGYSIATICSRNSGYKRTLKFLIVPMIAAAVPSQPIHRASIKIPSNIKFADPDFYKPTSVDILLGSGIALSILCVGQIDLSPPQGPELYLQKTTFGWVIGGSAPASRLTSHRSSSFMTADLQFDLTKFWEIEEGPTQGHRTDEEIACEQHFRENFKRDKDGRYVVALPFNDKRDHLGESRSQALSRLQGLERRLSRDPHLKDQYTAVIEEYISLGHMTPITAEQEKMTGYYLPHHAVIKESSQTTKVRVVFDGSAKTTSGISLNDALMVGPTIQTDLFSLLLRFRTYAIVLSGDIEKMYRQFLIRPEDQRYQRILWRNTGGSVQTYQLTTVTFGLSAAPYLAIRSVHQLAEDEANDYPVASRVLREDLYVDDALTGAETREEAIRIRDELTTILRKAGLNIRQWASNDPELFADLPPTSVNLQLQDSDTIKTLGVYWNSQADKIVYTVKPTVAKSTVTKRHILSETARIFDPVGLISPVIITAKIIMQKLWALKLDWDESLPEALHTEWSLYYQQLSLLNQLSFNRRTRLPGANSIELHGFCDASERAYGACIYLRSSDLQGRIQVELLTSKSRVAPLKTVSIPRLELCGAALLASLYKTVVQALSCKIDSAFFWTDSTIVLHWIRTPPQRLKTFVANRVSDIQTKTTAESWLHVRTNENPADLISRGMKPSDFLKSTIWYQGPAWLAGEKEWTMDQLPPIEELPELRNETCLVITQSPAVEEFSSYLLNRYSSFDKLQRIIVYILRFIIVGRHKGPITVLELRKAHKVIIRMVQENAYKETLRTLRRGKELDTSNKLLRLNPFIDQEGLLRVGGRLRNSSLPFAEKHPIVLPKDHHITTLLIRREHEIHGHAGVQTTLYALRRYYWPVDGRSSVWKLIKSCVRCCKTNPPPVDYIMGDLPSARINISRPFTHVGVDYCGPFLLKEKKYRNRGKIKVYVVVFVCLSVKAVHLEIVSDLTSQGFLAALRRFLARRGFCSHIYSDNGTQFVGTNNDLRELHRIIQTDDSRCSIQDFLSHKGIQWHFSPPRSPHFGGLWEAAVKSFKIHLKRVAGLDLLFTFEEFNTLVIEIEAILNSRPLTPLSNDPNDLTVLTPGHFLIGESLTSLRERDYTDIPINRISTWRHLQKIKEDFWTRWKREYLNELTQRSKWLKGEHSIDLNSIVLLKDPNVPSLHWPLGRVVEIYRGDDNVIRAVSVKTAKGIYKRGVKSLAPLPMERPSSQPTTTQHPEI